MKRVYKRGVGNIWGRVLKFMNGRTSWLMQQEAKECRYRNWGGDRKLEKALGGVRLSEEGFLRLLANAVFWTAG